MTKILIIHHEKEQIALLGETVTGQWPGCILFNSTCEDNSFQLAMETQPDVILLGQLLPPSNSTSVCKKLKSSEFTKQIPILKFPGIDHFRHIGYRANGHSLPEKEGLNIKEENTADGADILLERRIVENELVSHLQILFRLKNAEDAVRNQRNYLEEAVLQRTEVLERELIEARRNNDGSVDREVKYREMIHSCNEAIYLLYHGKFEEVNQKFQDMFAVSPQVLANLNFIDLVSPRSKDMVASLLLKMEVGVDVETRFEFIALAQEGKEIEVEVSVSPIPYKTGRAWMGVVRNITEHKHLAQQVLQSQKIEAIGRLAGGIAHDFNNILSIMRGYTELTMVDMSKESVHFQNMQNVISASERAKDLVNQILIFSRQDDKERESIRISRIIHEVAEVVKASLPINITLIHDIEPNDGTVMANKGQIRQVITNLCSNAIYAMRDTGGVLTITLNKADSIQKNGMGSMDVLPGPYIKLSVKDTGHGMTQDVVERIFDPYFTTKSTGEGNGMGLAVIHGIIKNHGGEIIVESEPGKGTVFHLYLPEQPKTAPAEMEPQKKFSGGKGRILFVDDEKMLVYMVQEMLERMGYDVVAVSNSTEALTIFSEDPEIFDLVITDQCMPGLTGIQLSRKLLVIRPDIPVILCTGFSETISREEAIANGITEFMLKPIIKRDIATLIRKILNKNTEEKEE